MEQKLPYARWKAADGAKALREGREPVSGPRKLLAILRSKFELTCLAMPESEINPFPELPSGSPGGVSTQLQSSPGMTRGSFSSSTRPVLSPPPNHGSPAGSTPIVSPKPSPAHQARNTLPTIDTASRESLNTPRRTGSRTSGAWSTVATPGVADENGKEKRFDLQQDGSPPTRALDQEEEQKSPGDRKNVRFAGPDGAPLSPARTHITVDSYDTPDAPPPTTTSSSPSTPTPPYSSQSGNGSGSNGQGESSSSSYPSAGPITPKETHYAQATSLATAPSMPPAVAQPHGLGLSSPPPSAPPMPALTSAPPTRKQVEQTQKHARWAISALEFDDIDTARAELRKALATIGG
jgi:vacuolar protein sorting-associated protein VTA1